MNTRTPQSTSGIWQAVILVICCLSPLLVTAQNWTGGGADQNWSTGGNWAGGVAPTSGSAVTFPDGAFPVTTNAQGVVNNIVQSSTTISSLTYNNLNPDFDTTQIPFGTTLTISGNLTIGSSDTVTAHATSVAMKGAGSLILGNGSSTFSGQSGTGNTVSVLDMSGLSNFVFNVGGGSSGAFNAGTGSAGAAITVTLATSSNSITVGTFNLGNNNTRGNNTLNLGTGTNIIFADTINLGISKTVGTMQFLNNAGGGLKIANHSGTGRATITLSGEGSSGGTTAANNGFMLLDGGALNILASTMTLGYRSNRASTSGGNGGPVLATGVLSFNSGTVDATTINMAINASTGAGASGSITNGGGTLKIGTGGLSMVSQGGANGACNGNLIVFNGGTVLCSNNIYKSTGAGVATISVGNSILTMASTAGTIGVSNGIPIDNFNITNSTLTLPVGSSAAIAVVNFNPDATTQNTINVSSMPTMTSSTAQFPIISYQTASGNLNTFVLGTLPGPSGTFTGYISNNTANSSIDLVITSGPVAKSDTWTGTVNNLWDTATFNWTSSGIATNYNDLDFVTFDDSASTATVNLTGTRVPATANGLTFNNNSLNYTLTGPGNISGPVQLVLNGSASVTLSETGGDNFSGGIQVNVGTLILDDTNSSISGGLTIGGGTIVQIGNNDGVGTLPSGALDNEGSLIFYRTNNISVGTAIPGAGTLTQNGSGTLTLTANNGFTGPTAVNAGTLALTGSGAIANSSQVGVNSATLDVSAVTANTATTTFQMLNLTNSTLNVEVGYVHTNLIINGSLNMAGTANTINVKSLPPIAVYPATNVLLNAFGGINGYNLVLGTLPTASPAYAGSISLSPDQTQVLLVLTAGPIGVRSTVTWNGVDALSGVNTNWSDAQNWQSPGTPIAAERVSFNNTAVVGGSPFDVVGNGNGGIVNPSQINNIVDVNSTNAGLTYANGSFHNTLINPAKNLIVNGPLAVNGSGGTVSILGAGGAFVMNNPSNNSTLNIEAGTAPTLDMSGLDTFTGTISQIGVGFDIPSSGTSTRGVWYMAKTNVITTGSGFSGIGAALVDGGVNSQSGSAGGTIYLGQTNALFVDGIVLGVGPATNSLITFNPSVTNNHPSVLIRGVLGGSSRVTQWSLGDPTVNLNNHAPGNGHVVDFSAGAVNAMVDTLTVGQGSQCNTGLASNQFTGILNMGAGILDVTSLKIGVGDGGGAGNGIGLMNVTGGTVLANTVTMAPTGQLINWAILNLTNATLIVSNGFVTGANTLGGALSVIDSTLKVLNGTMGTPTAPLTTLNLDGSTLQLNADANAGVANVVSTNIVAANITTINLGVITNVSGSAQIPLISYTGTDPYPNLTLGTFPAGYTIGNGGALVDNTGNSSIDVIVNVAVVTNPSTNANITKVTLSGTNLLVHGTNNNVPNTNFHYAVITSTNLATPLSNWTIAGTNSFNPDGTFDYTNPIVPGKPRQFLDVLAVP